MLAPRLSRFALSLLLAAAATTYSFGEDEPEGPKERKVEGAPPEDAEFNALRKELEDAAREVVELNRAGRRDAAEHAERRVRDVARRIEKMARARADRKLGEASRQILERAAKERAQGHEEMARRLEEKARELAERRESRGTEGIEAIEEKLAEARKQRDAARESGSEEETARRQETVEQLKDLLAQARERVERKGEEGEDAKREGGGEGKLKDKIKLKEPGKAGDGDRAAIEKLESALADARARRDAVRESGDKEELAKAQAAVDELKAHIAGRIEKRGPAKIEKPEKPDAPRERKGGSGPDIELLRKEIEGVREHLQRIEKILAKLDSLER